MSKGFFFLLVVAAVLVASGGGLVIKSVGKQVRTYASKIDLESNQGN